MDDEDFTEDETVNSEDDDENNNDMSVAVEVASKDVEVQSKAALEENKLSDDHARANGVADPATHPKRSRRGCRSTARSSRSGGNNNNASRRRSGSARASGYKRSSKTQKRSNGDGDGSSGEDYPENLIENYVGQVGALAALGLDAVDVLNLDTWQNLLDDAERESIRAHLPQNVSREEQDEAVSAFLRGKLSFFGDPRQQAWESIALGSTHPRVRRWRQRYTLQQRRQSVMELRAYHDDFVRNILVRKKAQEGGVAETKPASKHVNAARPITSMGNDYTEGWDDERLKRVLDFREQETKRYSVPEKPFIFHNQWGDSVVAPLKRGPALDGGRPREHPLLKNERPSHVTILCLVRDAASRLESHEGNRQQICDLLVESQYIREGATMAQLNQVVSGALDRLHYEDDACVRYDAETKHWCYLHNDRALDSFSMPSWAVEGPKKETRRRKSSGPTAAAAEPATAATTSTGEESQDTKADDIVKQTYNEFGNERHES